MAINKLRIEWNKKYVNNIFYKISKWYHLIFWAIILLTNISAANDNTNKLLANNFWFGYMQLLISISIFMIHIIDCIFELSHQIRYFVNHHMYQVQ